MLEAFKTIWDFSGNEKKVIAYSILANFINAVFYMFSLGAVYFVLRAVTEPEAGINAIALSIVLMSVSVAGVTITHGIGQLLQTHAGYFMVANKRIEIGNRLKTVPMGFFNDESQGRISAIATTILDNVELMAPLVMVGLLTGVINSVVLLISFTIFEFRAGLIAIGAVVCSFLVMSAMEKHSKKAATKRMESQTDMSRIFLEYIKGMSVIKAFNLTGRGGSEDKRMRDAVAYGRDKNKALEKAFTPFMILRTLVLRVAWFFIMILSAGLFISGDISIAKALMMLVVSFLVFRNIAAAGSSVAMLRMTSSSIEQAKEIEKAPVMDAGGEKISTASHDIRLEDVHFSYGDSEVIKGISVEIPDKSTFAIVGYSGSGKSTIASLIARFWDVDSGKISIGGRDIREYSLESLMDKMSIVFQDVYLFEDTIANNIKFGKPDATREEVIEAARKAGCAEFIENLPSGNDTIAGEGGAALSGGEKQRISIARAILKDSPIIILDEATASVDPENEAKLETAFAEVIKDKTVIMIAHRLKTVRNADKIIVMDDGRISEEGTHESLMQKDGIYKRFIAGRKEAAGWRI